MYRKYQIVAAIVGSVATYRLITRSHRRRYAEVARVAIDLSHQNAELQEQFRYLAHVLGAHDIMLDEFDLIALNNIIVDTEVTT